MQNRGSPDLLRQTRKRQLLPGEDKELIVDLDFATKRLRARRVLRTATWAILLFWPTWFAAAFQRQETAAPIWLMLAVGFLALVSSQVLIKRKEHLPTRDAAGWSPDGTLPRLVVFRRFAYFLDLASLSSLLPVLASVGRTCFIRNPTTLTLSGVQDPGTGWLAQPDDRALASLASVTFVHPNSYIARAPRGTFEAPYLPAGGWLIEAKRLVETSDFVIFDATGFNANLELEFTLLTSIVPAQQVIVICRTSGSPARDRVVNLRGVDVFFYRYSLWGAGALAEHIFTQIRLTMGLPSRHEQAGLPGEAIEAVFEAGRASARTAAHMPLAIHVATVALVCGGIFILGMGLNIPRIGFMYVFGGGIIASVAVVQYALFLYRWLRELGAVVFPGSGVTRDGG